MNKKIGLLLFAFCILGLFLWPAERSDQEQIQESLYNIVRAVSDRESRTVLHEISDTYKDETGWKKTNIRGILFQQFQQKESFSLQITAQEYTLTPPKALVYADVVLIGGSMWNPNADTMNFDVVFSYAKEEDGVWRMTGHTRSQKQD
jgi:hypothetical protein